MENYFQFPLCTLAMKKPVAEIIEAIISYGTITAGLAVLKGLNDRQRREKCDRFGLAYKFADSLELAAHLGGAACNERIDNVKSCVTRYHSINNDAAAWWQKYGRSPFVRLRADILYDMKTGSRMSWREFRVLAGIYSVIGAKNYPVLIRLSMIDARHCGFAGREMLGKGVRNGDCLDRLTPKQLRGTVEKLWQQRWFARVTPDPHGRKTYYSHRMTDDEMREKLFDKAIRAPAFRAKMRAKDQLLAQRIEHAKSTYKTRTTDGVTCSLRSERAVNGHRGDNGKGSVRAPLIETSSTETYKEKPTNKKGALCNAPSRFSFSPRFPYPRTEEEMYATLEVHGVEPDPDYDGNFFDQHRRNHWQIRGRPIFDWIALYVARLKVTSPDNLK